MVKLKICTSVAFLLIILAGPALAEHSCTTPLILDLNGDGALLYGVSAGVSFDINGDGVPERLAWTNPHTLEAFLWLDLNRNHVVDDGTELFGASTLLPTGEPAGNGFEALAAYDEPLSGGNADGSISEGDLIWEHLRLWIDSNTDGISQPHETMGLKRWNVIAISLDYRESDRVDGTGSWHRFQGRYLLEVKKLGTEFVQMQAIEDVFFASQADGFGDG